MNRITQCRFELGRFVLGLFVLVVTFECCAAELRAAERPNVLVVMVDDLGFSDIGCYGSEIETPHLDRLARRGLRFSQFYNTAKCHSSRISLLTGCYAYQAGNQSLSRAVTSAEVLNAAGYFTAMTGKWHLSREPTDFGFERYFGHLSGACNYFTGDQTFRLNGQPWQVPGEGFYTTVADVDFALKFLDEARTAGGPWYLYVAFNAPHAPLQPLKEDYLKYQGRYDRGWDEVRNERLEKQTRLNLFGQPITPSPRPDHVRAWDQLDSKRRRFESRRMTALAGMIDRVDQELGRLIQDLENAGEIDNTLILFVSDNGACPYDRRSNNVEGVPYEAETRWSDSTGWAWARNSPFRYYKQNQYEGGICTPAIVHWPAGLKTQPGSIVHQPAHLVDVIATLSEVCQAPIPDAWPDRELVPISGVSLVPLLHGRSMPARPPIHLLFGADRGLRDGDFKAVSFRSEPWELYDISEDRTELNDVADEYPDRLAAMVRQWRQMAEQVLRAPARSRMPVADKATGHHHPEWTDFDVDPGMNRRSKRQAARPPAIRARRDTSLVVRQDQFELTCTGNDAGIALARIEDRDTGPGPYRLVFRVRSTAGGDGEVYFTTDPDTTLPRGQHIPFHVKHDSHWHEVQLTLQTTGQIDALRVDPCSAPGRVTIAGLRLLDQAGRKVASWPEP